MDWCVLRPISTGWPRVRALKRFRSAGRFQGRALFLPITPFAASAAMRQMRGGPAAGRWGAGTISAERHRAASDGDRRLNGGMRVVALQGEIFVPEAEDVLHGRVDPH